VTDRKARSRLWLRACLLHGLIVAAVPTQFAKAQNEGVRDTYGEIGMLDMPSAHMAKDGELALVVGDIEKTQRFNLDFQALPWLETSFRYSHFAPGSQNYDRSFSLKARLFAEQSGIADISVGIRDLLGTGIYSSEYLVASKHVGPFDFTAGLGWGRLSDTGTLPNPFAQAFLSFKTRGSASATGGTVDLGQFFHGPKIGVFGGAIWNTPLDGVSVIAEYSSDKYLREKSEAPNTFPVRSPVPAPTIRTDFQQRQALSLLLDRNAHYARFQEVSTPPDLAQSGLRQALQSESNGVRDVGIQGATLIIDARTGRDIHAQCAGYAKIAAASGADANTIAMSDLRDGDGNVTFCPVVHVAVDKTKLGRSLSVAFAGQGLTLKAQYIGDSELWVYYENSRYQKESEAAGRIIRLLLRYAPSSVELFHLFPLRLGLPTQEITVARSSFERAIGASNGSAELGEAVSLTPASLNNPILDRMKSQSYPRFSWSVGPGITEQLFDPTKPIQFMLYASGSASVALAPGLSVGADVTANIWNDYNFQRTSDSLLPHVRTDLLKYIQQGETGISYLGIDYQARLTPDIFAETKAGYLEDMFMGAGGQILWRPENSRFAIGADAYQVWQRDFNRLFGAQAYNVLTGHVTVYYESPWYGLDFAVHAGRYLAGDYGATFEMSRRFSNGVEIGAFATFTNVPFSKFGEGSFDKGIILRIPLEWALPIFTQSSFDLNLRAVTRDGGQRLSSDDSLYDDTRRTSYEDIEQHFDDLTKP
jgi:hypothetical protein